MKRTLATVLTAVFLLALVPGITGCKVTPKKWYEPTLEYYSTGIKNGFEQEFRNLPVPDDLKDKSKQQGYLLIDLDKDGVDELLIGLIDDGPSTKFTNVIVFHSDLGPYSLLTGSSRSYISLCYDNVIVMGDGSSSYDQPTYMRWNHKDNAFNVIDGEGKFLPTKWELTPFT